MVNLEVALPRIDLEIPRKTQSTIPKKSVIKNTTFISLSFLLDFPAVKEIKQ
jgi:hypothetical protein